MWRLFETLDILRWFAIARRWDREADRATLEARQARLWARLRTRVLPRSPFYAARDDHPLMDKALWMAAFNEINTRGVRLEDAMAAAERAEESRDFAPAIDALTVGLSTGTSGTRGVFLVSPAEQRRWAGVMLAKLARERPFARRRVAFFLRANSRLYESVKGSGRITFRFFDLMRPLEDCARELDGFAPDMLIAPASVLRLLGEMQEAGQLAVAPGRVVSVAEVLHEDDRAAIARAFGAPIGEVYQATEGLLATTCELGTLHLNEEWLRFEREPLNGRRFAPIVTDLTRETQPIVRYRLDDVLIAAERPCACGRAAAAIEAIEGRCDDVCAFLGPDGTRVRVFPDFIVRAILGADARVRDFRVVETAPGRLCISLLSDGDAHEAVRDALGALAARLNARAPEIEFETYAPAGELKRRRVLRARSSP
ncbi:MAG: F390 synthetase-related protein [Hyphomonadaceae bacterium]